MLVAVPCPWTVAELLANKKPIKQPTPIAKIANATLRIILLPEVLMQESYRRSYFPEPAIQPHLYARPTWGSIPSFSPSATFERPAGNGKRVLVAQTSVCVVLTCVLDGRKMAVVNSKPH